MSLPNCYHCGGRPCECEVVIDQWPKTNRRRGELIRRDISGSITPGEAVELARLQRLADIRIDLFAPLNLDGLEQIHAAMTAQPD